MKRDLQLTQEQLEWWKNSTPKEPNPCRRRHGAGPEGKKCKECQLLKRKSHYSKVYFKCALRGDTNGPGTDHRSGWMACGMFKPIALMVVAGLVKLGLALSFL